MKSSLIVAIAIAVGSLVTGASAQTTDSLHYQGTLNDAGGPADGVYDFQFTVFDSETGGTALGNGALNMPGVTVTDGLFEVTLDFGTVGVLFDTNNDLFLEIAVRESGVGSSTIMSPRQRLVAAPRAQYAERSGTTLQDVYLNGAEVIFSGPDSSNVIRLNSGFLRPIVRFGNPDGTSSGGWADYFDDLGNQRMRVGIEDTGSNEQPYITLFDVNELPSLSLNVEDSTGWGALNFFDDAQNPLLTLGHNGNGASLQLFQLAQSDTAAVLEMNDNGAGTLKLFNNLDDSVVYLDADHNNEGDGIFVVSDWTGLELVSLDPGNNDSDNAVGLPFNSINKNETKDEPGVSETQTGVLDFVEFFGIGSNGTELASVTITVPTDGFVMVNVTSEILFTHNNPVDSRVKLTINTIPEIFGNTKEINLPGQAASGQYTYPVSLHELYPVTEGTHTFYFVGERLIGTTNAFARSTQLTAVFLATSYGTINRE